MSKNYKRIILLLGMFIIIGVVFYYRFYFNHTESKSNPPDENVYNEQQTSENKNLENEKNIDKKVEVKDREFKGENLKYNNEPIPVLIYHSIKYEERNELRVPKEIFREQMKYLKDNGYTTLTLSETYNFLVNNKPIPKNSVVITLDDGYVDNYENAYPILKEFGLNATVFVITANIDKESDYINSKQIKEMDRNGIDVESHTQNHDQLDKLSYDKQIETLKNSKESLESILNRKVTYIAYPFGKWNDETIKATKEVGYKMAFTTVGGWAQNTKDVYELDRVYISAKFGMNEFKRRLTNPNYNK